MSHCRPTKEESLDLLASRGIVFPTILDVGVMTATPELIKAFPDRHHCLFEPVAEFQTQISAAYRNISHEIINCAISDSDGSATIEVSTIIEGTEISHSAMVEGPPRDANHRTVPMWKLDSFLATYPRQGPFLLKIDIDGQELKVIEGASLTLRDTAVVIIEASYPTLTARLSALEAHGFEVFDIVEPCYYDEALWQVDVILMKPELRRQNFKLIDSHFEQSLYVPYRG